VALRAPLRVGLRVRVRFPPARSLRTMSPKPSAKLPQGLEASIVVARRAPLSSVGPVRVVTMVMLDYSFRR
jgi:hypothetical protein